MISKLSIILPLLSLAIVAGGQVWLSHIRYETSLERSTIHRESEALKQEMHRLNLELASLTRPERLRRIARTELGMAPPRPMQVVRP